MMRPKFKLLDDKMIVKNLTTKTAGGLILPGMPFILPIIPAIFAIWLPVTIFIILRVWSNCLMRRLTSCRLVPLPLAMR